MISSIENSPGFQPVWHRTRQGTDLHGDCRSRHHVYTWPPGRPRRCQGDAPTPNWFRKSLPNSNNNNSQCKKMLIHLDMVWSFFSIAEQTRPHLPKSRFDARFDLQSTPSSYLPAQVPAPQKWQSTSGHKLRRHLTSEHRINSRPIRQFLTCFS